MITIQEIDEKLKTMGDFLKIEYLETLSRKQNSLDVKKYIRKQISKIYANKGMYSNAAKQLEMWADLAITFKEKIEVYIQEIEMWVKAGEYTNADDILKRALANATLVEKNSIQIRIKQAYINQALFFEKRDERNKALKIYEKLYSIETNKQDKEDLRKKLLDLYEKTGKIREFMMFRDKK